MTDKAISPLRRRLIEDMTIRRLSPYIFVRIHRTIRTIPAMATGPIGYGHGRRSCID